MISQIINGAKDKVKTSAFNYLYRFLMLPVEKFKGKKLFGADELRNVHQALLSQNLFGIDGKTVPQFEKEFAKTYGVPYAVASTSGTAAIHTAIGALGLNPGDEITTSRPFRFSPTLTIPTTWIQPMLKEK